MELRRLSINSQSKYTVDCEPQYHPLSGLSIATDEIDDEWSVELKVNQHDASTPLVISAENYQTRKDEMNNKRSTEIVCNMKTSKISQCDKCKYTLYYNYCLKYDHFINLLLWIWINYILYHTLTTDTNYDNINSNNYNMDIPFSFNISDGDLIKMSECNISTETGSFLWFDALSFDFNSNIWRDKTMNNYDITNIDGNIKFGYLYDSKYQHYVYSNNDDGSMIFPDSLDLKENYTVFMIARYNGNDDGIIFSSLSSDWISGFYNGYTDVAYHINKWITNNKWITDRSWKLNVDQLNMFRSQQSTKSLTNNTERINEKNMQIKWGINIDASSDWAVISILVFPNKKLTISQIECLETFLVEKYNVYGDDTVHVEQSDNTKTINPEIEECKHWDNGLDETYKTQMVGWYDVNNELFDGHKLIDLSNNNNTLYYNNNKSATFKTGIDTDYNFKYIYGSTDDFLKLTAFRYQTPIDIESYFFGVYYVGQYNNYNSPNNHNEILYDTVNEISVGFHDNMVASCYMTGTNGHLYSISNGDNKYKNEWLLSSFYQNQRDSKDDHKYAGGFFFYYAQSGLLYEVKSIFNDVDDVDIQTAIKWTINGELSSDWKITEIIVYAIESAPYSFRTWTDTFCIEQYLNNKYDILHQWEYNDFMLIFGMPFIPILLFIPFLIWLLPFLVIGALVRDCDISKRDIFNGLQCFACYNNIFCVPTQLFMQICVCNYSSCCETMFFCCQCCWHQWCCLCCKSAECCLYGPCCKHYAVIHIMMYPFCNFIYIISSIIQKVIDHYYFSNNISKNIWIYIICINIIIIQYILDINYVKNYQFHNENMSDLFRLISVYFLLLVYIELFQVFNKNFNIHRKLGFKLLAMFSVYSVFIALFVIFYINKLFSDQLYAALCIAICFVAFMIYLMLYFIGKVGSKTSSHHHLKLVIEITEITMPAICLFIYFEYATSTNLYYTILTNFMLCTVMTCYCFKRVSLFNFFGGFAKNVDKEENNAIHYELHVINNYVLESNKFEIPIIYDYDENIQKKRDWSYCTQNITKSSFKTELLLNKCMRIDYDLLKTLEIEIVNFEAPRNDLSNDDILCIILFVYFPMITNYAYSNNTTETRKELKCWINRLKIIGKRCNELTDSLLVGHLKGYAIICGTLHSSSNDPVLFLRDKTTGNIGFRLLKFVKKISNFTNNNMRRIDELEYCCNFKVIPFNISAGSTRKVSLSFITGIDELFLVFPTNRDYNDSAFEYKYKKYKMKKAINDLNKEILFCVAFDFVNQTVAAYLA